MAKTPKPAAIEPPAHLSDTERDTYLETASKLSGPLSDMQRTLLEAYAVERARWQEAERLLREQGTTITLRNDKGEVRAIQENPQLKIAHRSRDATLTLGLRLGLEN